MAPADESKGGCSCPLFTNDAESRNNRLKVKKARQSSGFICAKEAVAREYSGTTEGICGCVSQGYEVRSEFVKFAVPNFMEWEKIEEHPTVASVRKLLWKISMLLRIPRVSALYQKAL